MYYSYTYVYTLYRYYRYLQVLFKVATRFLMVCTRITTRFFKRGLLLLYETLMLYLHAGSMLCLHGYPFAIGSDTVGFLQGSEEA